MKFEIHYEKKPDEEWYYAWVYRGEYPCGCEKKEPYGAGDSLRSALGNLMQSDRAFSDITVKPSDKEEERFRIETDELFAETTEKF